MNNIHQCIRDRINSEARARQLIDAPPMQENDAPTVSRLPYGLLLIAAVCAMFWAFAVWLAF
jgi:hypothetical protein